MHAAGGLVVVVEVKIVDSFRPQEDALMLDLNYQIR